MSVRKISELPYINVADQEIRENVNASKFEISYCDKVTSPFIFTSKHIRYDDFVYAISSSILGYVDGGDNVTEFYNIVDFHNTVNMYSGLNLSGDFYVNDGITETGYPGLGSYKIVLRAGNTTIYSVNENKLCATNNTVYGNFFVKNKNGTVNLLDVTENQITLHKPTTINGGLTANGDSQFNTITVTGTATFEQDIHGVALSARWADLAEYYESDAEYGPGTMIKFGGQKEITVSDGEVNGVVTTKPGFVLNADGNREDKIMLGIALVGRTNVLVDGTVKKFDKITHFKDGIGKVATDDTENIVGIALEDKETVGMG